MTDVPDARLLEQFVRNGSEAAFAALVERHIALVHSVATRHTANPEPGGVSPRMGIGAICNPKREVSLN